MWFLRFICWFGLIEGSGMNFWKFWPLSDQFQLEKHGIGSLPGFDYLDWSGFVLYILVSHHSPLPPLFLLKAWYTFWSPTILSCYSFNIFYGYVCVFFLVDSSNILDSEKPLRVVLVFFFFFSILDCFQWYPKSVFTCYCTEYGFRFLYLVLLEIHILVFFCWMF